MSETISHETHNMVIELQTCCLHMSEECFPVSAMNMVKEISQLLPNFALS